MKRRHRSVDQPIVDLGTHPAKHVTVTVLAEYLEVHTNTVYAMIASGQLRALRVGREYRIPLEAVQEQWSERRR